MSLDELKEKYHGGKDQSVEAFEELCGLVESMEVSYNIHQLCQHQLGIQYYLSIQYIVLP